jgi:fused signal recognition particle receptor
MAQFSVVSVKRRKSLGVDMGTEFLATEGGIWILGAVAAALIIVIGFIFWRNSQVLPTQKPEQIPDVDQSREIVLKAPEAPTPAPLESIEPSTQAVSAPAERGAAPKDEALRPEPAVTLQDALAATRGGFFARLSHLFGGGRREEIWENLEEALYLSDMGSQTVQRLLSAAQGKFSLLHPPESEDVVRGVLREEMKRIFSEIPGESKRIGQGPEVWLVVGVNGVGKTTTIGKLAAQWAQAGAKVLVAAGDTFRAAAQSQLRVWTDRAQVEIFELPQTKDPAAVAYSALERALALGFDKVLIDTAGRLHTAVNLMEELKKVKRVLTKLHPDAPQHTVLVLDASQGQNALVQARQFHQAVGLTGVILTKMDGTAKGGVAVGIAEEMKLPIIYLGVGEKVTDLRPFEYQEFVEAII